MLFLWLHSLGALFIMICHFFIHLLVLMTKVKTKNEYMYPCYVRFPLCKLESDVSF